MTDPKKEPDPDRFVDTQPNFEPEPDEEPITERGTWKPGDIEVD